MQTETIPNLAITFQGRKTSRQSSEQRRLAILQAALRVVARDGVRGVRHRAVAKEAEVPLSATTYYFKDIHDLLADAFTLFAQENMEQLVDPFWTQAHTWLQNYTREEVRARPELLREIIDHLAEVGAEYVVTRVTEHRERIVVEYAFWYAALQDERLHAMAMQHGKRLAMNFMTVLEYAGAADAELGAKAIICTLRRMEYEAMMMPAPDKSMFKQALVHQVKAVLHI